MMLSTLVGFFLFQSCVAGLTVDEDLKSYQPHSDQSLFQVLSKQDEIVEITLLTELDSLLAKRKTEEYRAAQFSYLDEDGIPHTYSAKVKPRGRFRRMTCDFPPLKIKFEKNELEAAGLRDFNEMKLVTHCLQDEDVSRQLVLREYLTYKLYNELTPNSLKVKLVRITYRDRQNASNKIERLGFLIEDKEEFSDRTGGKTIEKMGTKAEDLSIAQEKLASVFQYMIGNTDWSIELLRNVELLQKGENGKLIPVPYDFDFSGIVRAPYARPNVDVGQRRVGERVFMGKAKSAADIYATLSFFRKKQEDLLGVVQDFELLDENSKEQIVDYLSSFFAEIETQEKAQMALFTTKAKL